MRKFIAAAVLAACLLMPALSASAAPVVYTDPFGNTYTLAQMQSYCHALRPGSAQYVHDNCAYWLAQ